MLFLKDGDRVFVEPSLEALPVILPFHKLADGPEAVGAEDFREPAGSQVTTPAPFFASDGAVVDDTASARFQDACKLGGVFCDFTLIDVNEDVVRPDDVDGGGRYSVEAGAVVCEEFGVLVRGEFFPAELGAPRRDVDSGETYGVLEEMFGPAPGAGSNLNDVAVFRYVFSEDVFDEGRFPLFRLGPFLPAGRPVPLVPDFRVQTGTVQAGQSFFPAKPVHVGEGLLRKGIGGEGTGEIVESEAECPREAIVANDHVENSEFTADTDAAPVGDNILHSRAAQLEVTRAFRKQETVISRSSLAERVAL